MIDYTRPLNELPDPLPIEPLTAPFDVTITPPGSKSITCRAYVLAALAGGESRIVRPLRADDTDRLLDALCTLGTQARWEGDDVLITGVNGRFPRGGTVNLGDGGTPTRFMIAAACLAAEPVVVDGSKRMRERPIAEGVEMLRRLGAHIEYVELEGRLPVRVSPGGDFDGADLTIGRTASSQFVSALLLVSPCLRSPLALHYPDGLTSASYVKLTTDILGAWGVSVTCVRKANAVSSHQARPAAVRASAYGVEPDASSAVYWVGAALIGVGSMMRIMDLDPGSPQPDMQCITMLRSLGDGPGGRAGETSVAGRAVLDPADADMSLTPDAALLLAAIAARAAGATRLTGLGTLRVKETDRLAALASELRRIGCTVETTDDSITIDPSTCHDEPVTIETYNDHRMAMAFAILGLARPGISIRNPRCVDKSYPTFWRDFATLYE